MEMKKCMECHTKLKSTAKFCTNCGTKVDPITPTEIKSNEENLGKDEIVSEDIVSADTTATSPRESDVLQSYFYSYGEFLKETLIKPSAVFISKEATLMNGLISLGLYSLVLTLNTETEYFMNFIRFVVFQAIIIGILYLVNKFLIGGADEFLAVIVEYGGLINSQILLFLFIWLFGIASRVGIILFFLGLFNQVNIIYLYILQHQGRNNQPKVDKFYQLVIAYIPLYFVIYQMFREFLI